MNARIGSMCTGYGGLDMAVQEVLGGTVAWHADKDPDASKLLAHRFPQVPNLGDLTVVDWLAVEPVDIVTAGFPCQDISYAGRGAGIKEGTRSGLWHHIADALGVLRPPLVVLENVSGIVSRRPGLDVVLADLAALGFDAEWTCVRASDVGAPHPRRRWFLIAQDADRSACGERRLAAPGQETGWRARANAGGRGGTPAADSDSDGLPRRPECDGDTEAGIQAPLGDDVDGRVLDWGLYGPAIRRWEAILGRPAPWATEPGVNGQPRLTPVFVEWLMGLPAGFVTEVPGISRNAQLRILGNGVVSQQGAHALRILMAYLKEATA